MPEADALTTQTKRCNAKKYYLKNKHKIKIKRREYYQKNRKLISERAKSRYKKNRESILKRRRLYYKNNRKIIGVRAKKHAKENQKIFRRKKFIWKLKERYNLTKIEYIRLLKKYNNSCGICQSSNKKRLVIDHDHKKKKVRGLLCRKCNSALGFLNDNLKLVKKAWKYLKKSQK